MLRGPKRNLFSPCSVLKLRRDEILVFSPKYRGKVLLGDVAEVAEVIIRETCKELDIEIITNFLERHIKNKKSKSFYIPTTYV
jgi:hypothetical protein